VADASGSFATDERHAVLARLRRTEGLVDGVRASAIGAFLHDRCIVEPAYGAECGELYAVWAKWCTEQPGNRPGTAQIFDRDLRAVVPGLDTIEVRDLNSGEQFQYYRGVGLDVQTALAADAPEASGTGGVADAWGFTPAERAAALARLRPQPIEALAATRTPNALPTLPATESETVAAWAERAATQALDGYESSTPAPD
jgi:hypothetical protein